MKKPLHILHLEDNKTDAELVKEIISLEKINFKIKSVDNRENFFKELESLNYDIILADYSLPSFDGLTALKEMQDRNLKIPFILVSAVLGEELAIEALHKGATDYVLKSRLERLVPAIQRAMREVEERKQRQFLENEISQLEKAYQRIAERVRGFLKMEIPSGKYSLVDKFIEELSGYSAKEWYGTPNFLKEIIHEDFNDYYLENFLQMQEGIIPKMLDYKIVKKDGEERWWLQFSIGSYDINQKLISVSIVIIDNTDSKESFIKYQNLFENALVGMFRTDISTGKVIDANLQLAKIHGFSSIDEFKRSRTSEFYINGNKRNEFVEALLESGSVTDYQVELLRKDGSHFWCSISAKAFPKEGFIEGTLIDISDKKSAEEALVRNSKALQLIAKRAIDSESLEEFCSKTLQGIIEILNFDSGSIRIYDKEKNQLLPMAHFGLSEKAQEILIYRSLTDSKWRLTKHLGKPVLHGDILEVEDFKGSKLLENNYRGYVSWPLNSEKKGFLGSIQLGSFEPKEFIEEDEQFFQMISDLFVTALEKRFH